MTKDVIFTSNNEWHRLLTVFGTNGNCDVHQ
jgi:hypothetical protein